MSESLNPGQSSGPGGPARPTGPAGRSTGPAGPSGIPVRRTAGPLSPAALPPGAVPPRRPPGREPSFNLPAPPKPGLLRRLKYPLRWLVIAALIYTAVQLFKQYDLSQYINQKEFQALIAPLGQAAPLAFMGLFVLAMLLMVIPYALMAGLSTLLFGPAWGMLWTVLGGTLAALAVWGLSRLVGQRVLASKQDDPRWKNLNERLRADGFYYLLLVRALSIVPFNILNFACACTSIRLRDFLLANLIGLIPSAFVYGYGVQILLDPKAPKGVLMAFVGVVAMLLVTPLVFRQARRQRRAEQRQSIVQAFETGSRE